MSIFEMHLSASVAIRWESWVIYCVNIFDNRTFYIVRREMFHYKNEIGSGSQQTFWKIFRFRIVQGTLNPVEVEICRRYAVKINELFKVKNVQKYLRFF